MSAAITLAPGAHLCPLPAALPLETGDTLGSAHIAYECWGDPASPLVVVLGGISAGRHVTAASGDSEAGWWDAFVGPGRAIDTDRWFVIGMDWLAGHGASSGPAASDSPAAFPRITTADQAAALEVLLDHLGGRRAHAIVGASYGGMVALAFTARFGTRVERVVALGAAHRSHPRATAWRSIQRRIVRLGLASGHATASLELARALAITTYRTTAEFEARFDGAPLLRDGALHFPVERYLEHHGRCFGERFTAESFLLLSESLDLHRIEPAAIQTPTTLVAFQEDALVPPAQIHALARDIGGPCRIHDVASVYGHDAFLKEIDALTPILTAALAEEVAP